MNLEKELKDLKMRRLFLINSDDRCYTNGKLDGINREIRNLEKRIKDGRNTI